MDDFGYLVREIEVSLYEVTKWGLKTEPEAIYLVRHAWRAGRWLCNSPGCSGKSSCKHSQLVQKWLKGRPKSNEMPTRFLRIEG